jgi:hypothetical protein
MLQADRAGRTSVADLDLQNLQVRARTAPGAAVQPGDA